MFIPKNSSICSQQHNHYSCIRIPLMCTYCQYTPFTFSTSNRIQVALSRQRRTSSQRVTPRHVTFGLCRLRTSATCGKHETQCNCSQTSIYSTFWHAHINTQTSRQHALMCLTCEIDMYLYSKHLDCTIRCNHCLAQTSNLYLFLTPNFDTHILKLFFASKFVSALTQHISRLHGNGRPSQPRAQGSLHQLQLQHWNSMSF